MPSQIIIYNNIIFVANSFYLSFFRAPGGELQMVLDKDEVPSEPEVARLMRQILDGLHYLHTINVAHLDIKVRRIKKRRNDEIFFSERFLIITCSSLLFFLCKTFHNIIDGKIVIF